MHANKCLDIDGLREEILQEKLSEEQLKEIIERFSKEHSYCPKEFLSCTVCGIHVYGEKYQRVAITSDRAQKFRYSDDDETFFKIHLNTTAPVTVYTDATTQKEVQPLHAVSYYQSSHDGHLYHFHPELVDVNADGLAHVTLCEDCYSNKKKE